MEDRSLELVLDARGGKVRDIGLLVSEVRALRERGRTVVHCHGDFDRLQADDVMHLRAARAMGDLLVVTVTPDDAAADGAASHRFPPSQRAELVAALDVVDLVAVSPAPTAAAAICLVRPSIYVKPIRRQPHGVELTGATIEEQEAARRVGAQVRFTTHQRAHAAYLDQFSPEVNLHLEEFRSRYSTGEIVRYLEQLRSLRVAVIGEAIIDEYVYCEALGKSGKEPVLAMRYLSSERHAGGSLAIANHLANFCQDVSLLSYLGAEAAQEPFVREHLSPRVRSTFVAKSGSPTIVKRRFLDYYSRAKLFAIYKLNDESLAAGEEQALCDALEAALDACDLALVADFGHGLITGPILELLCRKAPFLAVNTQLNAANVGYHTVSRYPRADYISVHEGELRLDSRSRKGDLRMLTRSLAERLDARMVMVTRGKNGSLLYHRELGFFQSPAFATRIVDRIGAGDAVYALTSLCAAANVPPDVLNFLGNLIGAQAVAIVGNRESVDRRRMSQSIDSLLNPQHLQAA